MKTTIVFVMVALAGAGVGYGRPNQAHPFAGVGELAPFADSLDAGVQSIVQPSGIVDSGDGVLPTAVVKNFGPAPVGFRVRMKIGQRYNWVESVYVLAHATAQVVFNPWTALERGPNVVRCSTMLPGDTNPANDAKQVSVTVRVVDAGVGLVLMPPPNLVVYVKNCGTIAESVPIHMDMMTPESVVFFSDAQSRLMHPGDSIVFSWPEIRQPPFLCLVVIVGGDMNPSNDTLWVLVPNAIAAFPQPVDPFRFSVIPSPFRSSAQVSLVLDRPAQVVMRLWDKSGRLRRTLMQGRLQAGAHTRLLAAAGLEPGVYVLDVEAGARRARTKLILE